VRHGIRRLLRLGESPERLALSLAIGVFVAFSPLFGLHTLLVILVAFLLRLNVPLAVAGAFVNNPWTMVPMYAGALAVGLWVTGYQGGAPDLGACLAEGHGFLGLVRLVMAELRPFLLPFVLGCLVLGLLAALLAYAGLLLLVRWVRSRPSRSQR
jgi:uncharacterized protein (DUF2062 family)